MLIMEVANDALAQSGPYDPHAIQTVVTHDVSQWFMVGLGVLGFIITIITLTGTIVWQASNIRDEMNKGVVAHREEVDREIDEIQRRFGEVATALRDKITQVELFMRDEFIRKETFNLVIDRITAEWKAAVAEIASRHLRMEGKLDELNRNLAANTLKTFRPKIDQNEPS